MKKKRILSLLLSMIVCIAMMPVAVFATGEGTVSLRTVEINVEAENTENDDYKIDDGFINLRKTDVQYVLTGTTDRKIQIWGSNSPDPVKTFHIRLNEATINGGIDILNRGRESAAFVTPLIRHGGHNITLLGNINEVG